MSASLLKKLIYIIAAMLALMLGWFCARFFFGSSNDYWSCVNGEWVKYGETSLAKPTTPCPEIK